MIWLIGGTYETSFVEEILKETNHITTYKSKDGLEFNEKAINKKVDSRAFIEDKNISLVIDVSHPFAKNISKKVRNICQEKNILYLRYNRSPEVLPKEVDIFYSYQDLALALEKASGTVFFTTGSKEVEIFEKIKRDNRFVYRILPTEESIKALKDKGVKTKDIVAMLGPFSKKLNQEMLKHFKADYLVTKNSGQAGGVLDKIQGALEENIKVLVLDRKEKEDQSFKDFLKEVEDIVYRKI